MLLVTLQLLFLSRTRTRTRTPTSMYLPPCQVSTAVYLVVRGVPHADGSGAPPLQGESLRAPSAQTVLRKDVVDSLAATNACSHHLRRAFAVYATLCFRASALCLQEFCALDEQLKSSYKGSPLLSSFPPLPPRGMKLFQDHTKPEFVDGRRRGLATYLRFVLPPLCVCQLCPGLRACSSPSNPPAHTPYVFYIPEKKAHTSM
jgi:hypothetical protein